MGLKKCPECGGAISTKAESCPHCGSKTRRRHGSCLGCAGVVVLVLFVAVILSSRKGDPTRSKPSPASNQPGRVLSQGQEDLLAKLQQEGYLTINPQLNRADIAPAIWDAMDAKLKEDFAAALAIYCGNRKGTQLYWVEVYDKQSGKKLAKYSESWGFTIY